ncbi:MAG TPA: glycosyltransferase family 1 protein [Acidimicrobiales bacterium]|nr:glycosyltransferase family 1 protein [Acidimicrobiales bacterium]
MPPLTVAVHVGQLLQPVPGGIGRYVRALLPCLPAAGVEPVAFAAGPRPDGLDGVRYVDLGWPRGPLRYEAWHRLGRPRLAVEGDVVHATSLAVPPPGDRPLVVTVHDLVVLRAPDLLTRRGVAFHRAGLERARRLGATLVVPTAWGGEDLVREGIDPSLVHVAHHGVEVGPAPAAEAVDAALERLGVRPPFVLFVGTLEPRKGVGDLLAASRRLQARHPEVQLVLAGGRGWGELPELTGPGVVAPGSLGDDDLDALYRSAAVLALPSRYEGFGLPVVEAMARGCPVVCSDAACLPEVAGGAAELVPVGDVAALADALGGVLDDGARRDRLVAAGRTRAAGFTWAASAEAHARAYRAAQDTFGHGDQRHALIQVPKRWRAAR